MSQTLQKLSNDLADAVERASKSVVGVHARPRTPSSGIVWRPGIVVTTDHTTERDEEITVALPDGKTVPASIAGRDSTTDLAVLKIEANGTPAATLADPGSLRAGHLVLAVGRGPSVAHGVVSSAGGEWRTWRGGLLDRFIRLDIAIYHGFSGGALVDTEGNILGVNTSALARGLAATIPGATVTRVVDELLVKGRIARGYLGVGMHPVRIPNYAGGVVVLSVEPDSPAGRAGLLVGDVLLSLDGKTIEDTDDVQAALDPASVGRTMVAGLLRGGARVEIPVRIGERPRGDGK